jgi:hypothetical protein
MSLRSHTSKKHRKKNAAAYHRMMIGVKAAICSRPSRCVPNSLYLYGTAITTDLVCTVLGWALRWQVEISPNVASDSVNVAMAHSYRQAYHAWIQL